MTLENLSSIKPSSKKQEIRDILVYMMKNKDAISIKDHIIEIKDDHGNVIGYWCAHKIINQELLSRRIKPIKKEVFLKDEIRQTTPEVITYVSAQIGRQNFESENNSADIIDIHMKCACGCEKMKRLCLLIKADYMNAILDELVEALNGRIYSMDDFNLDDDFFDDEQPTDSPQIREINISAGLNANGEVVFEYTAEQLAEMYDAPLEMIKKSMANAKEAIEREFVNSGRPQTQSSKKNVTEIFSKNNTRLS